MRNIATNNEIFFEQQPCQSFQDHDVFYQKSSEDNENEYLSQFLNNEPPANLQQINSSKSDPVGKIIKNMEEERSIYSMDNQRATQVAKKRQKSCFHNFQKHLVITLRNIIKIKRSMKPKEAETIGYEMWCVFTKSTLYSKKFLHVLFGVYGNNEQNEFSKNFLNQLGFMEIFAKYSEDDIKQAQKYLRKEIIEQLQKLNLKQYLHFRKLKRVDQFKTYIEEFLGELREGSIRKRLPKDRKMEMVKQAKQSEGSPQTHVGC